MQIVRARVRVARVVRRFAVIGKVNAEFGGGKAVLIVINRIGGNLNSNRRAVKRTNIYSFRQIIGDDIIGNQMISDIDKVKSIENIQADIAVAERRKTVRPNADVIVLHRICRTFQ